MPLSVELPEVLDAHFRARMDAVHTAIPARVTAYHAATQTVDAVPVVKAVAYDEDGGRSDDTLPTIPSVPVCWPSGGGFFLSFPLAVGDHVLLVFSEAATGDWRLSGSLASPSDTTRHGLNGAFAIPCARPDAQALQRASGTAMVLGKDASGDPLITVDGVNITLGYQATDHAALASKVDNFIAQVVHLLTTWIVVPQDGGAALKTAAGVLWSTPPTTVGSSLVKIK